MSEAAIMPRPESRHVIVAKLDSEWRHRTALMKLASEFAALDFGPILVIDRMVQPREIKLPDTLKAEMLDSAMRIHALEIELSKRRFID